MQRVKRTGGFTLIELLVVVAIIALLISILVPSLRAAKEQTRTLVCKTRLRELYHGHVLYAGEWDDRYPDYDRWLWRGPQNNVPSRDWVERGEIYKYILNKETYFCPKDDRRRVRGGYAIGSGGSHGEDPIHSFVRTVDPHVYCIYNMRPDWADGDNWGTAVHYMNPDWLRSGVFSPPLHNRAHHDLNFHASKQGRMIPGEVVLMYEEHQGFEMNGWWQLNDGYSSKVDTAVDFMSTRHKGKGHFLFWDGHVVLGDSKRFNRYPADNYAQRVTLGGPVFPPR